MSLHRSHPSSPSCHHLSPGAQHWPPGGSPKSPASSSVVCPVAGETLFMCSMVMLYTLLHSKHQIPNPGAGQEGSSESGPCRRPQGHAPLLQLHFLHLLPFRLSTCPPPQDAGTSWSLCLDHCPSLFTWLTPLPYSNSISLPQVDL